MLKKLLVASLVGVSFFCVGCGDDKAASEKPAPSYTAEQQAEDKARFEKMEADKKAAQEKTEADKQEQSGQDLEFKRQIYQILSSGDAQWNAIQSASLSDNETAWHFHNKLQKKFIELSSVECGKSGSDYFDKANKVLEYRNKAFSNVVYCQKNYGNDKSKNWGKANNDAQEYIKKANDSYASLEKF